MVFYRSVFTQCLAPFGIGTGVVGFVLFMGRLRWMAEVVAEQRLTAGDLALALGTMLPGVLEAALPFGVLVAVFAVVMRLSQQHELLVMQLAGFNLWKFAAATLLFAVLAAGLAATFSFWLRPAASSRLYAVKERIEATYTGSRLRPGKLHGNLGEKVLRVGERLGPNEFAHLFFADRVQYPGAPIVLAQRGRLQVEEGTGRVRLHLFDGTVFLADPGLALLRTLGFGEIVFDFRKTPVNAVPVSRFSAMSTSDLLAALAAEPRSLREHTRLGREVFERLGAPLTCFVFALLGIPGGLLRHRSGQQGAFLRTFLAVIFYYLALTLARDLTLSGSLAPAWLLLPPAMLAAFGLLGIWRLERAGG